MTSDGINQSKCKNKKEFMNYGKDYRLKNYRLQPFDTFRQAQWGQLRVKLINCRLMMSDSLKWMTLKVNYRLKKIK